jgi:hypothetical protein
MKGAIMSTTAVRNFRCVHFNKPSPPTDNKDFSI